MSAGELLNPEAKHSNPFPLTPSLSRKSERAGLMSFYTLAADGMNKMQLAGVQHQARSLFGTGQQETAIQVTAQNRVAQVLTVDAQLMGSNLPSSSA
jgi:hypothetical protein